MTTIISERVFVEPFHVRRERIATAMLAAMVSSLYPSDHTSPTDVDSGKGVWSGECLASKAVEMADLLLAELCKGKK